MKKSGILYWITGLSGAGKTTIGNRLYYELKKEQENVVFLDGDILKTIFDNSPGYSKEDRINRAYKYAKLCKSLTEQGLNVVCCTIAMFEEVRIYNRKNNRGYVEVFLDTPMETLLSRDQKGIYSDYMAGKTKNICGKDIEVEFPKNPDIVIVNDDSNNLEDSVMKILDYTVVMNDDYGRDLNYWNSYYEKKLAPADATNFAKAMYTHMEKGKSLLELGCGNGRDSIFFAENGINVTAIDASDVVIAHLQKTNNKNNIWFVCDDFVKAALMKTSQYDYIYSRFTLHAIRAKQQEQLLENVFASLKKGGLFFIEARSVNDDLYGKGEMIEKNAYFYNNHFRRFIELDVLCSELENCGFTVISSEEKTGFAECKSENPPIIRVICKR